MLRLNATDVVRVLPAFATWLTEHGAEILEPTNEYELVRFKTGKGTFVIYRKKALSSAVSFIGEAETAWNQFKLGPASKWRAVPRTRRVVIDAVEHATLRKRDGDNCFFCDKYMPHGLATIEHLVALTHGGPQHISNKYLAHRDCNKEAGCLSAVEKIRIYTRAVVCNVLKEELDDQRAG